MSQCPTCRYDLLPITHNGVKKFICGGGCGYVHFLDDLADDPAIELLIEEFVPPELRLALAAE